MVAGKSFVSANSIDGSWEVEKWTWREGVKFRSKRLEKKCYESIRKRSLIYHRLNEYKCYHQMDRSGFKGPKWTELTELSRMEQSEPNGSNWLNWAEWSKVDQMDRNRPK